MGRKVVIHPGIDMELVAYIVETYLDTDNSERVGYGSVVVFGNEAVGDIVVYGTEKSIIMKPAKKQKQADGAAGTESHD